MGSTNIQSQGSSAQDESQVRNLYRHLLESWNRRAADEFAALFADDGNVVGFDGSLMNGWAEVAPTIRQIFEDHVTAAYVGKIREVRFLAPGVALLRAVSGMVPPGGASINPAVNAIQSLVAVKHTGEWRISHYQNTPAQFHGRPELAQALTDELQELL
jgi:uncharacterized protein (TIGR02246 family)